jgi:tetratricopeptide (TPR) repeat protein
VQQDPESFVARWELGYAYHWNGQHQEAADVLEPMWADSGHSWVALGLAPAYASLGRGDDLQAMFDSLLARRSTEYVPPFVLAECVACLGDIDSAIAYCEEAVEARDMLFALVHRWLPDFGIVRADARFAPILARFNARGRH